MPRLVAQLRKGRHLPRRPAVGMWPRRPADPEGCPKNPTNRSRGRGPRTPLAVAARDGVDRGGPVGGLAGRLSYAGSCCTSGAKGTSLMVHVAPPSLVINNSGIPHDLAGSRVARLWIGQAAPCRAPGRVDARDERRRRHVGRERGRRPGVPAVVGDVGGAVVRGVAAVPVAGREKAGLAAAAVDALDAGRVPAPHLELLARQRGRELPRCPGRRDDHRACAGEQVGGAADHAPAPAATSTRALAATSPRVVTAGRRTVPVVGGYGRAAGSLRGPAA